MSNIEYINGTLYDVVYNTSKKFASKEAYEFMGKKTTYSEFVQNIDAVAKALIAIGVKEDEIICIAMPNVPQAITMYYAANKIGAICNMIHPLSSENEMLNFLNRVECKTLLMMDQFYDSVKNIRKQTQVKNLIIASVREALPRIKKIPYDLTIGRKIKKITDKDIIRWNDFIALGKNVDEIPSISDRTDKCAAILHSGGTTGKIKGVCLSNKSINACAQQMISFNPFIDSSDRMLSVMPIFHGNGLVIGVHTMFLVGATCFLVPRFTPKSYVHDLLKHKCNYMSGVPALFERMIQEPEIQKADLSFMKGVFSGADSLSVELERKIDKFLEEHNAKVRVRQGYGMTEGVVATTLMPSDRKKEGSIGVAFPDVSIKIVKPGTVDEEVPVGETGEITFSSLTNMMGYYKDEEETNISLKKHKDGLAYVHSGDLGTIDEEGYLFFKGRIKRMIITNGYNVFPLELENIIEGHEYVLRSCVVGIPDAQRGEKVKAWIILKEGIEKSEATKQAIKEYCTLNIAKYAMPREIEFIDEFPKTKVGKVDFKQLIK